MRDEDEDVEIDYDEIKTVGESYFVIIAGGKHYLPISQCTVKCKRKKLYAPEWLLLKEGLI